MSFKTQNLKGAILKGSKTEYRKGLKLKGGVSDYMRCVLSPFNSVPSRGPSDFY